MQLTCDVTVLLHALLSHCSCPFGHVPVTVKRTLHIGLRVHTSALLSPCLQAFLMSEDIGDTLDAVEALVKRHSDFEKLLVSQDEKFKVHCVCVCTCV